MLEVSPRPALGGGLRALKSAAAGWGWGRDCGGARGPIPRKGDFVIREEGVFATGVCPNVSSAGKGT